MLSSFFGSGPKKQQISVPVDATEFESTEPLTPLLAAQSGGEPVRKSGYFEKRGGTRNRAYKKRWLVLTEYGKALYFHSADSTVSLGTLSLCDAEIAPSLSDPEITVTTPNRVWEFKFNSLEECSEWLRCFNEVSARGINRAPSPFVQEQGSSSSVDSKHQGQNNGSAIEPGEIPSQLKNPAPARKIVFPSLDPDQCTSVRISCATWNLSEQLPEMEHTAFLQQLRDSQLVAIAVQESQPVAFRQYSSDQLAPVDVWQAMAVAAMGKKFVLVGAKPMGAIHISVFARADIASFVADVNTGIVPCGIGNVMYNKGAVGVSLRLKDKSIGFVSAHLAANRHKVLDRNANFWRIDSNMPLALGKSESNLSVNQSSSSAPVDGTVRRRTSIFQSVLGSGPPPNCDAAIAPVTKKAPPSRMRRISVAMGLATEEKPTSSSLAERFDHCFFFGDLNYRIEEEIKTIKEMMSIYDKMKLKDKSSNEVSSSESKSESIADNGNLLENNLDEGNEIAMNMRMQMIQMMNALSVAERDSDDDKVGGDDADDDSDDNNEDDNEGDAIFSPSSRRPIFSVEEGGESVDEKVSSSSLSRRPTFQPIQEEIIDSCETLDSSELGTDSSVITHSSPSVEMIEPEIIENKGEESSTVECISDDPRIGESESNAHIETLTDDELIEEFKIRTGLSTPEEILKHLLSLDQLNIHRADGKVLIDFDEPEICFKPSYKFDPYTETYDTGKKDRGAAWCDRVLYSKPKEGCRIEVLDYRCIHGVYHSDHRAVIAEFNVSV